MFKKIVAAWLLFSAASWNAFAANFKGQPDYKSSHSYKRIYKGELPPTPKPIVKPIPEHADAFLPCSSPTFVPGPYLGLNPGLANNYNRTSSIYRVLQGTLFAGYAMLNDDFYLAAELFAEHGLQIQNYRNDLNGNGNPIGLKTTWGAGLSVLPGYLVSDTLLAYLRMGVVKTHFQDVAQSAAGGQVGVGLQGTVSANWDLRAEYLYTFYQSLTGLGSPRSDSFRLGVLYKFWG